MQQRPNPILCFHFFLVYKSYPIYLYCIDRSFEMNANSPSHSHLLWDIRWDSGLIVAGERSSRRKPLQLHTNIHASLRQVAWSIFFLHCYQHRLEQSRSSVEIYCKKMASLKREGKFQGSRAFLLVTFSENFSLLGGVPFRLELMSNKHVNARWFLK